MSVEIGQQISHYEILEKLGEGGMGVVYKAHDTSLNRPVALKFLPFHLTQDEPSRKRFVVEAQAASALDHPNICAIHEINETPDGQRYICMAYYPGDSLREKIKKGPISLDLALNIFIQLAQGLAVAHEQKIIHRDIKPGNIIITERGEVKIVDFGLAKLAGVDLTKSTSSKGTAAYMCPEQVRGGDLDHRCDIWSLGVVFFEMLTGHLPFEGEYPEPMMYSIVNEDPRLLSDYLKDFPELLQNVITKCLRKDPSERYQNLTELLVELKPLSNEAGSIAIRRKSAFVELLKERKKVIFTGVAVLIILIVFWIGLPQLFQEPPRGNKIAVLPKQNPLPVAEQKWFTEGMAAGMISKISQISGLIVKHPFSTMQYWGTSKSPAEIATEIDVDYIVQVSTVKTGDNFELTAELVDPLTNDVIWSNIFQRETSYAFRLQGKIAQEIAAQVHVSPTIQEQKRFATTRVINSKTYELYLKGISSLNKMTPEGIHRGLEILHQTVENDPEEPLAYASLALGYSIIAHTPSPPPGAAEKARENALKALELDDRLADAHLALAMVKIYEDWDRDGAEQSYKRALNLNPSLALAHVHYGWYLRILYQNEEGLEHMQRAIELDPFSPGYYAEQAFVHYFLGNYDKCISGAGKALELNFSLPNALTILGFGYSGKGMHEKAIESMKNAADISMDWKWGLGVVYAKAGQKNEALKITHELEIRRNVWDTWCLAVIYATLGDREKFFHWLDAAYRQRHPYVQWMMTNGSGTFFGEFMNDPRFIEMAKKLNLPE